MDGLPRIGGDKPTWLAPASRHNGLTGYAWYDLNRAHLGEKAHEFIHFLAIRSIHDHVQGVLRLCASRSLDFDSEFTCVVTVDMREKHLSHLGVPGWT